jgi:hypothetical protein
MNILAIVFALLFLLCCGGGCSTAHAQACYDNAPNIRQHYTEAYGCEWISDYWADCGYITAGTNEPWRTYLYLLNPTTSPDGTVSRWIVQWQNCLEPELQNCGARIPRVVACACDECNVCYYEGEP